MVRRRMRHKTSLHQIVSHRGFRFGAVRARLARPNAPPPTRSAPMRQAHLRHPITVPAHAKEIAWYCRTASLFSAPRSGWTAARSIFPTALKISLTVISWRCATSGLRQLLNVVLTIRWHYFFKSSDLSTSSPRAMAGPPIWRAPPQSRLGKHNQAYSTVKQTAVRVESTG